MSPQLRRLHTYDKIQRLEKDFMCGICGYSGRVDYEIIKRMTESLTHRGPDDRGIVVLRNGGVGLGHRRLAILDLSEAGHQPMCNAQGTVYITYNGEIYNFLELRKELENLGYSFHSQTDTEVILASYEEYGIEMVSRFKGIFSFALYDSEKDVLYLVRDHLGVKPLYYADANGVFVFASEIKAILAANVLSPNINFQALWDYLTYLYVPCPLTMYEGIFQVPAGHILELSLKTHKVSLSRYWCPFSEDAEMFNDVEEAAILLKQELANAVRQQLISDVPVGAMLSGGIDSTIVVGLMAAHSSEKVRTFTAIFSDSEAAYFNERKGAARVSKKFDTIHEEIEIPTPSFADIMSMVHWADQPFGNPTLFLSYLVAKEIRRSVKVALSGAGGDELFGGYVRYKYYNVARMLTKASPIELDRFAEPLMKLWPCLIRPELRRRVKKFISGLIRDNPRQYLRWTYFLSEDEKRKIVSQRRKCLSSERIIRALFEEAQEVHDEINILQYVDLLSYLRDDILEYTDKSSMATSLEVRVPFLSPQIVQLSFRIPGKFKIRRGQSKIVLKKAFKDFIPKENLSAPKRGFTAPIRIWTKEMDTYFEEIHGRLPNDCPLNLPFVNRMREEHRKGVVDHGQVLFGILMLETWMLNSIYK